MFLAPGTVFQGFRILSRIGQGSYGNVYKAENHLTEQVLALKIVPLSGDAGRRELHALRTFQNIEHTNLLKIHHAGIAGENLYYTMDLADGPIADQHLDHAGLLAAARKLADALDCLHKAGLLHRDIKPDNLFWRHGEPVLGDIGLVTGQEKATLSGTPGFMSPRILLHGAAPDPASDVYALAKSFYCLLSGNPPERYPDYQGPLSGEASVLLNVLLNVCDTKGAPCTAGDFRDALRSPFPRKKFRLRQYGIAALAALAIAGAGLFLIFSPSSPKLAPASRPEPAPDPYPEYAPIRKALAEFDAASRQDQSKILRQNAVAQKLKQAGTDHAEKQLPTGKTTSMHDVLTQYTIAREYTRKAWEDLGKKDPAFRRYYLQWEKLESDAILLRKACAEPDKFDFPETEFKAWKKLLEEYLAGKKIPSK